MGKNEMKGMQTACRQGNRQTRHAHKRKNHLGKRLLSYVLTLALVLGLFSWGSFAPEENVKVARAAADVWNGSIATAFAGGGGSATNPYLISTGVQLVFLAQQVNAGTSYSNKYFVMTVDIDLNNIAWTPIGTATYSTSFQGNFYGKGHIIKNVKISAGSAGQNTCWPVSETSLPVWRRVKG